LGGSSNSGSMMFEALESRRLLSGVWYDSNSMSVIVNGTQQADNIRLSRHGDRLLVEFNQTRRWFDRSTVRSFEVNASGGGDLIDARQVGVTIIAYGGAGNDTIIGGTGNDHLYGSDGSDRLVGFTGDDDLHGEGGRDLISGDDGRDTVDGGGGDDLLWGNAGEDYLLARSGNDTVDGGDDPDVAEHYFGQRDFVSIEAESILNTPGNADPYTYIGVTQRKDGKIVVTIRATHFQGGYSNTFGEQPNRNGRTFNLFLQGIDLGGPGSARTQALVTEEQSFILGKLADGAYTFKAGNEERLLATNRITVSDGKLVNTVAWAGPYSPIHAITFPE
jgi:Ca2+-binding RTX toxin-like protein